MNDLFLEQEMLGNPVRSLQYMLGQLALEYDFLPLLVADGIFGARTLEAVMLFQRELFPPVTGVVDRGTWNAIRELWMKTREKNAPARPLRAYPPAGMGEEPGVEQEVMVLPQTMFRLLSRHLNGIQAGQANGVHDSVSVENVKWLQRVAGLRETGILDRQTWNFLSRLYELFIVQNTGRRPEGYTGGWG
jgi:peptidoglycan hydrolase-like protein with peptidoglycan-binding domain